MKILSPEQIRDWDQYTITHEPITSLELMERAATRCTEWILSQYFGSKQIKIFCGKGNNGGDGLAIARLLSERGVKAEVYIIELGALGTEDFQSNLHRLHSYPINIHFVQSPDFFPDITSEDLVIDAILGSGISRHLEGLYKEVVSHIKSSKATVISIDVPTGLLTNKATISDTVICADHTLTFQILKLSFLFPENEKYLGEVHVLDIELPETFLSTISSIYTITDEKLVREIYKPRKKFSHKGTYGNAIIVAGERGKMGAAVLCAKACLRSGAGLVTALIPAAEFAIMQTSAPEAMAMAQEEISSVEWARFTTVGIGPGLGTGEKGSEFLRYILAHFNQPMVIDADGLNLMSTERELLNDLPPGSILTPHPKEFERLFGKMENHLERIHTARYYAQKLFVYIIVKGHYSFVACPDGEVYFNSTGNPGMATGGSGDVLTGILTSLLAQGYSSKDAAIFGMYIHGLAGDLVANKLSEEALLAGDIVKYLGHAFLTIKKQ